MALRVVEVIAPSDLASSIRKVFAEHKPIDVWSIAENEEGGRRIVLRALVDPDYQQSTLDALQDALSGSEGWQLLLHPLDAAIPKPEPDEEARKTRERHRRASTREVLYNQIEKGAKTDADYLLFVALSTLVAGAALVTNNVAVLIGAMVIAPFLGPNLAFAFGAALGDKELMRQAVSTLGIGCLLAVGLSVFGGLVLPFGTDPLDVPSFAAKELLDRTSIGFEGLVIALASGACAALALTSGTGASLVGVMVAVALLPPAVAIGLMIGTGNMNGAIGAAALFLVNVVCVNFSALVVFRFRGIEPRAWLEKFEARQSRRAATLVFGILLVLFCVAIFLQQYRDVPL
jgi:uncharacterized hydrophobic protein (TIGR00341 family)